LLVNSFGVTKAYLQKKEISEVKTKRKVLTMKGMSTVQEYRLNAGLSKNELYRRADVDYQTLTSAENGEPIQARNAQNIVNALSAVLVRVINIKEVEGLRIYQP
jgi:DNA-binding XRE family transcriptional regulator